jgi:hypothetical protein
MNKIEKFNFVIPESRNKYTPLTVFDLNPGRIPCELILAVPYLMDYLPGKGYTCCDTLGIGSKFSLKRDK